MEQGNKNKSGDSQAKPVAKKDQPERNTHFTDREESKSALDAAGREQSEFANDAQHLHQDTLQPAPLPRAQEAPQSIKNGAVGNAGRMPGDREQTDDDSSSSKGIVESGRKSPQQQDDSRAANRDNTGAGRISTSAVVNEGPAGQDPRSKESPNQKRTTTEAENADELNEPDYLAASGGQNQGGTSGNPHGGNTQDQGLPQSAQDTGKGSGLNPGPGDESESRGHEL